MIEMFEKKNTLDKNFIRQKRIPLLNQDPTWEKLFGDAKDRNIQNTREELAKLIAKEKEMERENRRLQKEKLNTMKMILGISDSVNNENKIENISLLDKYKEVLEGLNEELEELRFHLETLPGEIREANLGLLNATIKFGYDELKDKEEILEKSESEISILRERLRELIEIKHDYEEWINDTYLFFHGLLGSEVIEKIDRERLK